MSKKMLTFFRSLPDQFLKNTENYLQINFGNIKYVVKSEDKINFKNFCRKKCTHFEEMS